MIRLISVEDVEILIAILPTSELMLSEILKYLRGASKKMNF